MVLPDVLPRRAWPMAMAAGVCALAVLLLLAPAHLDALWPQRLLTTLCVAAAAGAAVHAVRDRRPFAAWLAAGIGLWAAGSIYFTSFVAADGASGPTPADAFWLASYVPLAIAVALLVRAEAPRRGAGPWLDGALAALATAAIGSALVLPSVSRADPAMVAVNFAYPLADLALLGLVAGGCVVTGARLSGTWGRLAAGLVVLAAGDLVYVVRTGTGTYDLGALTDLTWPLALCVLATLGTARPNADVAHVRRASALVPLLCSTAAGTMLFLGHFLAIDTLGVLFAAATVLLGLARTALAFRANARLEETERQALTDELTGLGNRRRLVGDLERLTRDPSASPATLVAFDLDGFKGYNDAYGHPAGDALLSTLGGRLGRALGAHGTAYRPGGDEFCVLVTTTAVDHDLVTASLLDALHEEGDGFAIGCSYGTASIPGEVRGTEAALQLADSRMYAQKDGRRASTRRQSRDLLLQLLHEQQPDLEAHSSDVGDLVEAVGRRLGLAEEELDHTRHAAELHDVGKVAIPSSVLDKPGPLDDEEWRLMRRHTVVGERILGAVPALVPVGRIIRASHERWDGGGYPDGLAGEGIPLGARVIAVCDSFHAITSDRPYRAGRSEAEAIAELRRCAGTQFDPEVVEAFAAALELAPDGAAGDAPAETPAVTAARRRAPARAAAHAAAGELATLVKLRGLLHASDLARGGAGVQEVLEAIARTIASSLGFRTVAVSVLRPEWDDLLCTAVVGPGSARELLLGRAAPASQWRPYLDARFLRGGAHFVPAGAVEDALADWHVPDLPVAADDEGAWHPDDVLVVALRGSTGEVLGVVSVDEPVWGRRPTDAELEVLSAVVGHAALALEAQRAADRERRRSTTVDHLSRLGRALAGAHTEAEVAQLASGTVRAALGFGVALFEHPVDRAHAAALERLLAAGDARERCVVLAGDAARKARLRCRMGGSRRNGRGPRAWADHLVAAPVRGAAGELLAVVWVDDPASRLVPDAETLRPLATVADAAAVPLAWLRRGGPGAEAAPELAGAA